MEEKIQTAKNLIAEADAIVIGAGAGLSSAAGTPLWRAVP